MPSLLTVNSLRKQEDLHHYLCSEISSIPRQLRDSGELFECPVYAQARVPAVAPRQENVKLQPLIPVLSSKDQYFSKAGIDLCGPGSLSELVDDSVCLEPGPLQLSAVSPAACRLKPERARLSAVKRNRELGSVLRKPGVTHEELRPVHSLVQPEPVGGAVALAPAEVQSLKRLARLDSSPQGA